MTYTLETSFNSLHADYAIARGKSLSGNIFTRALIVAMPSGKECDSYPLDERRLKCLFYKKENYFILHLRTNEALMGHLAVEATGYFQGIVLGCIAGSLREKLVCLFYYLLLHVRTNAFWDCFELYRGYELLELVRVNT